MKKTYLLGSIILGIIAVVAVIAVLGATGVFGTEEVAAPICATQRIF